MRPCPYCGKEIQDEAIVCRYCGLDVERPDWLRDKHRCPYCAEWIGRSLTLCPYCKSDLTEEVALFDSDLPSLTPAPEPVPEPPPLPLEPELEQDALDFETAGELDDLEPMEAEDALPDEPDEAVSSTSSYFSSGWSATPPNEEPMRAVPLDKSGNPMDSPGVQWLQFDWQRFRRPALIGGLIMVVLAMGVGGAYAFRGMLPTAGPPDPSATPSQTPRPTVSEAPATATLLPASTQAAAATAGNCIAWDKVSLQDARKTMCVYGVVKRWFAAGDLPFVAIFSEEPGTFALVDRDNEHPDVRPGECIRGEGEVEVMSGTRPFIDIKGVVLPCP